MELVLNYQNQFIKGNYILRKYSYMKEHYWKLSFLLISI